MSIDEEEEELRKQFDVDSVSVLLNNFIHEPFRTVEQIQSEIVFMLQEITPDSGYCDDFIDSSTLRIHNNELFLKNQTIYSLNNLCDGLNTSIKDLSRILVEELSIRDELDYEQEIKNTFISLVLNIQVG